MEKRQQSKQQITAADKADFFVLQRFFHENGLEVDLTQRTCPENVLGMWQAKDASGARLGAVKLELRAKEFVVGCIAVAESRRRENLGTALLQTALQQCKVLSARRVLLVAKVPEFFKVHGFYQVSMEDYRAITKCYRCSQRGNTCHPQVLRLDV